ncbi:MAG TPA: NRDE family protein [Rhizomicrobium sp.]|nr:NRDE family protein [Rhizomicrobium sp.]
MCVLALAWCAHPRWRLVMAGNRDELHARPAQPLARWDAPNHLLAGKDLQSGGTWLGVSEQGRFGVVTNLRGFGPPRTGRPSRGILLRDLLSAGGHYACPSEIDLMDFNPLNLINVDFDEATFLSNRPTSTRQVLAPGVYGLSNGSLNEPWPKTVKLKSILLDWVAAGAQQPEHLLDKLRDDTLPEFGEGSAVPSDVPQEAPISPIFIKNSIYGTRCSTIVAIDALGQGFIVERRFTSNGDTSGETALSFSWRP